MENDLNNIIHEILRKIIEKETDSRSQSVKFDENSFRKRIEALFKVILKENRITFSHNMHEEVLNEVLASLLGLGPLEKLLKDATVSEIMVNGPNQVYVERNGSLEPSDITFKDNQHLMYFIEKITSPLGRRVTELEPYIDTRLSDGSRVNIVKAPVSSVGPLLTIRKFSHNVLSVSDMIKLGTLNETTAEFLKACIISRLNMLICGGASTGKTTLLTALASFIPDKERVITIEDTRELRISKRHTVPLETRPTNIEGKGEITIRDLIRNALHMRPDRIIIGEVRSGEVLDMIQAMNIGHEGSMTTLHANSAFEAMDRLEVLSLLGNPNMTSEVARRQIIGAIDLVINMARLPDGSRKMVQVSEVIKLKEYSLEDIIVYNDEPGHNGLEFTGKTPTFYGKLKKKANYSFEGFRS